MLSRLIASSESGLVSGRPLTNVTPDGRALLGQERVTSTGRGLLFEHVPEVFRQRDSLRPACAARLASISGGSSIFTNLSLFLIVRILPRISYSVATAFFLDPPSLQLHHEQRRFVAAAKRRPDVAPQRDPNKATQHREHKSRTDENRDFHGFFVTASMSFATLPRENVLILFQASANNLSAKVKSAYPHSG